MPDVVLCETTDEQFLEIQNEIDRRRKPRNGVLGVTRSAMVFFDSTETLLSFCESPAMRPLRNSVRVIAETASKFEKESGFLQATEQGAITLMIREFGRGTDFKCFDNKMLSAGGVHVIQAFFSIDITEEIQIMGRGARQGRCRTASAAAVN